MATSSFKINVNGDLYSATNCRIDMNGTYRYGLRTLTFKEEVPKTEQHGTASTSVGRTTGNYKVTVSIEILKHEGDLLLRDLQKKATLIGGETSVNDISFDIGCRFVPKGSPGKLGLSAVEVLNAQIMGLEEGIQTGGDATVYKMDLSVIRPIRRTVDGVKVTLVPDPVDGFGGGLVPVGIALG